MSAWQRGQRQQHRPGDHRGARFQAQRGQILANRFQRGAIPLQKEGMARPAAERFDADRAGAGVRIHKRRALDARRQNVEERLAQTIGRGPRGRTRNALQAARPELSRDHSHQPTVTSP